MAFGETDYSDINLGKDMRRLMTTFESRNDLDKPDIEVIRQLGLSFRGSTTGQGSEVTNLGFFLVSRCARAMFVTTILQQAVDVCLRAKDDPDLILIGMTKSTL